jgi:hypothetical protein
VPCGGAAYRVDQTHPALLGLYRTYFLPLRPGSHRALMFAMPDLDRVTVVAQLLSADVAALPFEERQAFRYLLARLAVEVGAMEMTNDVLPEGRMRLVLHLAGTKRTNVAERPRDWTAEEEE